MPPKKGRRGRKDADKKAKEHLPEPQTPITESVSQPLVKEALPKERNPTQYKDQPTTSRDVLQLKTDVVSTVESTTKALQRLGFELTPKDTSSLMYPKRPGFGRMGTKIDLLANYFRIDIPHGEVYHYDIIEISNVIQEKARDVTSEAKIKKYKCLNTKNNRIVVRTMIETIGIFKNTLPAYDGEKNLYTRNPLPITGAKSFTVVVDENGRPTNYEVKIQPVQKEGLKHPMVSLEPLHELFAGRCRILSEEVLMGIMALETILRHGPALHLVPVGRSFFQQPRLEDLPPLSGGLELWFGHHQSLRIAQWKPMLNINMSATTFYKRGSLLKYMIEFLNPGADETWLRQLRRLTDADRRRLAKELKGLRVEVKHLAYPRKYRISDISVESAENTKFIREMEGRKVSTSVAEYFRTEYKRLVYPNLPCLIVGTAQKTAFLPFEVCDIVEGQHYRKKLSNTQTSEIIRFTAIPPAERFRKIQNTVRETVQYIKPYMTEFGIRIETNPLKLEGRILNPPHVIYDQQQKILPNNGSWDMKGKRFFAGSQIQNWVLLSFSTARYCNYNSLEDFSRMLCDGARRVGINISPPTLIKCFTSRDGPPGNIIKQATLKVPNLQLAIIVLPSQGPQTMYTEIKNVAETELGLVTQCVKDVNTSGKKCNPQLICNLCQKINAKMGGVNNSLLPTEKPPILRRPVIIIGADCSHPSPGDLVKPSVAALVGSLDGYPSRFKATVRVQESKVDGKNKNLSKDIIVDFKDMVIELLKAFYQHTKGKKPEKIVVYRDGVSEGEFNKVVSYELKQVREACKELAKGQEYKPPITFIIVNKHHHTRFAPMDPRRGVGKCGNIPPGTTVDTDVIHPLNFDFFMCSHFGIQGTSRPAHYTVLWDDNDFSADELQVLTYYLCHTYVRCTRTISIPCPVRYAHLAAFRAKQYLVGKYMDISGSESDTGFRDVLLESDRKDIKVSDKMENDMYFV